jgi:hypothetical protein
LQIEADLFQTEIGHLTRRQTAVASQGRLEASPPHTVGLGVDLAVKRRAALARADLD